MRPSTVLLLSVTSINAFSLPSFLRSYSQFPIISRPDMTSPPGQDPPTADGLSIADLLPQTQKINIFASLTRDIDPISDRLDNSAKNSTILAPLNSAIQALKHKPWEDEDEVQAFGSSAEAYQLGDGERRADDNLRRFVERHIVPQSPWKVGEKVKTLAGSTIWWEERDGHRVIMPGEVKVDSVAGSAENGQIWVLAGVIGK